VRGWKRPPLWLAAGAEAAALGALYSLGRWLFGLITFPIHEDIRYDYVAAEAGLRFGWSRIYDFATLRMLSQSFPAGENSIGADGTFISPPPLAWLFVPLVAFPEPVAYVIWTLVSLAALVWAWHIAAPYRGLAKVSLLLLALALWPVMQAFYYGQPAVPILGLVALAWWLMRRDRPIAAGVAIAVATALKPQVVIMIPVALLVTGRWRAVAGWVGACAVLVLLSALALGSAGLASYLEALRLVQSDTGHAYFTPAYLFGLSPVTYAILIVQGAACIAVAIRRRDDLDVVFALGLLGSLMVSIHLHQMDYSNLVLAAWLVLRGSPPMWHRVWLAAGIVTMQLLSLGQPVPQLIWDVGWLAMLGLARSLEGASTARRPVET
jgi:glycosyl transferase family 87